MGGWSGRGCEELRKARCAITNVRASVAHVCHGLSEKTQKSPGEGGVSMKRSVDIHFISHRVQTHDAGVRGRLALRMEAIAHAQPAASVSE